MTAEAEQNPPRSDAPKLVSDDLPLRVFTTIGTTVAIAWLDLPTKYALLGVALAPFVSDVFKLVAVRFRLGKVRLLLLTLLFFLLGKDRADAASERTSAASRARVPGSRRAALVTGVVASTATVAAFTGPEVALGHSLVADRELTFFSAAQGASVDGVPPQLHVPASVRVDARGPTAVAYRVTATDGEDGAVQPACRPPSGHVFAVGSTIVRCTATDAAGNRASGSFSVIVHHTSVPIVLVVPADRTAEATSGTGAAVDYLVRARTQSGRDVPVQCAPPPAAMFPLGRSIVTCVATVDGRTVTRRFAVVVRDTRPPVLRLPSDITAGEAGPQGRIVTYAASAIDAVDGEVPARCTPRSGSLFAVGTDRVTCVATDSRGRRATGSFTVVVVEKAVPADTEPPTISLESDVAPAEATSPAGASVRFSATAEDDRDGRVDVACEPRSDSTFPVGRSTVGCSAVDSAGNKALLRFVVVVRDTRPPVLRLPPTRTAEATWPAGAVVSYSATATDVVDGTASVSCSPASGTTFPLGDTAVRCTSADAHGNTVSRGFGVSVRDTTPPSLRLLGETTAEASSPSGALVRFSIAATDRVDGRLAPACTGLSPNASYPLGQTTISCTATDRRGNRGARSFVIEVVDTTGPRIASPGNLTAEAKSRRGAVVAFRVSARDVVSGVAPVTCSPSSGSLLPLGSSVVTCSASDARGNRSEQTFTVTVRDTSRPNFVNVFDIKRDAVSPDGTAVTWPKLYAVDRVDGRLEVTCDPKSGSLFPENTTTRVTCTATDRSGNVATATFTVTIGPWVE
jgi:large repetitive protein